MIKIEDIIEEKIHKLTNWYDNPLISEIASMINFTKKKPLLEWFGNN